MDYYYLTPLLFLLRILEVLSQMTLVFAIFNAKVGLKKFMFGSIIFTVSYELIKVIIPHYLSSIIAVPLAIMTLIFIFKFNYKKAIFSYLITIISISIIDCIVSVLIIKLSDMSTFDELTKSDSLMILGKIIIAICMFFLSAIVRLVKQRKNIISIENIKTSTSLVTLTFTFFLLAPNFAMILYYHDKKTLPLSIIIINIVAIIATFVINIFNTQRGIKLVQAEEELITEKTYNSTLQHLVDSLRTFKHDSDNTLITIDGYIFTEDWDGLKVFFKDVIKENKNINALNRLNPELFKNPCLFGLVTAKFEYARSKDVTLNFEIYADLNNIDMKPYDFTRILGIFLDNAIEAAVGSEKKMVNFYVVERNNKVTIELSNSFSDTGLKIDEMTKKGVSSKGKNRGLGLYKVKDILSRYSKVKHETTAQNGIFLQRLIIDKVNLPIS